MEECGGICGKQLFFGCFLLSGNSFFCSFQLGGVMLEDTCFFLLFVFECMCVYVLYVSSLYLPGSHCEKVVKFVHIYILYIFTYALFKYAKNKFAQGTLLVWHTREIFCLTGRGSMWPTSSFLLLFLGVNFSGFTCGREKGEKWGSMLFFSQLFLSVFKSVSLFRTKHRLAYKKKRIFVSLGFYPCKRYFSFGTFFSFFFL